MKNVGWRISSCPWPTWLLKSDPKRLFWPLSGLYLMSKTDWHGLWIPIPTLEVREQSKFRDWGPSSATKWPKNEIHVKLASRKGPHDPQRPPISDIKHQKLVRLMGPLSTLALVQRSKRRDWGLGDLKKMWVYRPFFFENWCGRAAFFFFLLAIFFSFNVVELY